MPHHFPLITTLAAAFGFVLVPGFVAVRLRQPALVGYLIAGILIGPATPGFVADLALSRQLADIGVMLLMFGVGLHFSLDDLLAVRRIALPGVIVQIVTATAMPTETKNNTENASRSGRVSLAARWLSADTRNTMPARKAPSASDTPNTTDAP
jgi:predicted Kef-type K+ transport protein